MSVSGNVKTSIKCKVALLFHRKNCLVWPLTFTYLKILVFLFIPPLLESHFRNKFNQAVILLFGKAHKGLMFYALFAKHSTAHLLNCKQFSNRRESFATPY